MKNDQAADHDPLDLPGLALVTGGLFSLVFGFSHAETTAWSNPFTIGFLILGVVLLVAFAFLETRARYPLLPLHVVLSRTRGGSMLAMLFASIGIFGVFLFLTYYLQGTLGYSPVKTGVAFLPMVAALATMAQVSNRILLPQVRTQAHRAGRDCSVLRRGPLRAPPGQLARLVRHPRPALHHPARASDSG